MMVRPSISVDTITPPAVSKTESPASSRAFSLFKAAAALPSLVSILADRPKIVFGVLEVILRRDPIPGESFGTGHGQIAFIASLEVLNITRLGTDEPGRLISSGGLRSAEHSVGHDFRILRGCPVNTVVPLRRAPRAKYPEGVEGSLSQPPRCTLGPLLRQFI
jgi:hypothetical protein